MSKCGKGCLPECEYFTTGGCISPFNCAYKIEEHYQNTVFTSGDINALSGIEKFFINTVKSGVLPQEPMNYDGAAMKAYISYLESENAALRERLGKAMLNRCIYYLASIWNDATMTRSQEVRCRTVDYVCDKFVECNGLTLNWDEIYFTREAAEASLAELKGEVNG